MNEHKTTATGVAAKVSPTNSVFNVRFARHSSTACNGHDYAYCAARVAPPQN
jgi:hypothetical protein